MCAAPSSPNNRLIAPRPALASCVRAIVARSTLGCALTAAQRLNRFPASSLCSITWFIEGAAQMIEPAPPTEASGIFGGVLLGGPRSLPLVTYNPGPVHAFVVMFYPSALHRLTGIDMSAHVNHFCALDQALGPAWVAMGQAVMAAPDDDARVMLIEQFLEPLWQAVRARDGDDDDDDDPGAAVRDWVLRLGARAAASGWGRGARNIERRIKAWTGQPMRTLRRMNRAEKSLLDARDGIANGTLSWADVAARGGYSDQSHLCRESREVTGLSPTELARSTQEDESFWLYRIWS